MAGLIKHLLQNDFVRFLVVGGSVTTFHYVMLVVMVQIFFVRPWIATSVFMFVGALLTFTFNAYWSFKTTNKKIKRLSRHAIVSAIAWVLNLLFMLLLNEKLGWNYMLVQIMASIVIVFMTYFASKFYTYAELET